MHPPLLVVIASFTMAIFVTLLASGVTGSAMLPDTVTGLLSYVFFTSSFVLTYFRFQGVAFLRLFRWRGANRKLMVIFLSGLTAVYCFGVFAPAEIEPVDAEISVITSVILITGVVFTGPVFEELFYRGILFDGLLRKTGTWVASLVLSSLFALMHYPASLLYAGVFFIYGLLFCALKVKYKSLLYPLVLHISANLLLLTMS
ncbi:lysostaphin resistance A-like protein [Alteromonas sp. H39]|uniref:CPBP family intramembrane glutamic endopeptidase n=1 Tax=Alteromonas sp. H39 TaxID=3389876 RepID=UPI0039E0F89D